MMRNYAGRDYIVSISNMCACAKVLIHNYTFDINFHLFLMFFNHATQMIKFHTVDSYTSFDQNRMLLDSCIKCLVQIYS